ncbi:MAG: hypothetical protein HFG75_08135 [Hungatella sp.]|nr:hypothetical protein [Hungatella sp.]
MKDERNFKEVIHTIKGAEKDKDKFLRASRLSRNERKPMENHFEKPGRRNQGLEGDGKGHGDLPQGPDRAGAEGLHAGDGNGLLL